jgi:hypothetical protein
LSEEPISPATRARAIFSNQGMHRNAEFIAALHDNAIDYLEQAPILAASFGVKVNTRADRLFIAMRIGGPIQRGERLRNVMASVGIAGPLRKLAGSAIYPYMSDFVRELNDLTPSILSQAIPERPGDQRKWLKSMSEWRSRMRIHGRSPKIGFSWIARYGQFCAPGEASDFADFVRAHETADIHRWSFERMANETRLWHDQLAANNSVSSYGMGLKPDTIIDLSDWPDHEELQGFEFFKLATPSMIMEEGRRMRHCVASYIPTVMAGRCHLYSIRREMRRMATLEIVGRQVRQLKAFANKLPAKGVEQVATAFVSRHIDQRTAA